MFLKHCPVKFEWMNLCSEDGKDFLHYSGPQVAEWTSQSVHSYYSSGNERTAISRYTEVLDVIKITGKCMCAMMHQNTSERFQISYTCTLLIKSFFNEIFTFVQ